MVEFNLNRLVTFKLNTLSPRARRFRPRATKKVQVPRSQRSRGWPGVL
jgi:hypothetical protein